MRLDSPWPLRLAVLLAQARDGVPRRPDGTRSPERQAASRCWPERRAADPKWPSRARVPRLSIKPDGHPGGLRGVPDPHVLPGSTRVAGYLGPQAVGFALGLALADPGGVRVRRDSARGADRLKCAVAGPVGRRGCFSSSLSRGYKQSHGSSLLPGRRVIVGGCGLVVPLWLPGTVAAHFTTSMHRGSPKPVVSQRTMQRSPQTPVARLAPRA